MKNINQLILIIIGIILFFSFSSHSNNIGQASSLSSSGECIICTQVIPNCSNNETIVLQACNECAHCISNSSSSGSLITLNKNFSGTWKGKIPSDRHTRSKTITLKLCVKDQKLDGIINIPNEIKEGKIISQNIISNNEIKVTVNDKNNSSKEFTLELKDKRHLFVSTASDTFETRKISFLRNCSFSSSSSGEIKNCSPKGTCRGENGTYLSCPEGTECSGLPAYGCYPPGCPVPICCSPDTKIKTTGEQKRIADIRKGELVLTDEGKAVRVKKVSKTPVKNHKVLKITLNDGTVLEISPSHPTADGRKLKDLKMGDALDGRMVVEIKLIPYLYSHTYDILPDSKTGNYYANGVLIGSSLKLTK